VSPLACGKTANNFEPGIPVLVPEEIQNTPPDACRSAHFFGLLLHLYNGAVIILTESLQIQNGVDECVGFS